MQFPDVWNQSLTADEHRVAKEAIDYAISIQQSRNKKNYSDISDNFNGTYKKAKFDYLVKTYGKESRTKYVDYKIGRSKVMLLIGEFLYSNLTSDVHSINRDAMNRKYQKYIDMKALAMIKPQIEAVRSMGLNVFPGVNIPSVDDKAYWDKLNFKEKNEVIMQKILNWRINVDNFKLKLTDAIMSNVLYNEIFGVIEEGPDGVETIRIIDPDMAMYNEIASDVLCEKTPYFGEEKSMYYHDIMRVYGDKMSKEDKERLKLIAQEDNSFDNNYYSKANNRLTITVHEIQIKCAEELVFKNYTTKKGIVSSKRLSKKYMEENPDILSNPQKYNVTIEKFYKQSLFCIAKIANEIYVPLGYKNNQIQTKKNKKKLYVEYDFTGILPGTVKGTRISIFQMIIDLSITYNIIRFMINRELAKSKGKVIGYDRAFMEGKNIQDVFFRMAEEGVVDVNSAKEGLEDINASVLEKIFKEMDLGLSNSFQSLILAAQDIERTIDRITGINQNREGITRSTETATGVQESISASRNITNHMSYSTNVFIQELFRKFLERIKINRDLFETDGIGLILSDHEIAFLKATYDVSNDEYGVIINDGRKEMEVKQMIQNFYGQQVNAMKLGVHDIARAEMENSFTAYVNTLEAAWDAADKAVRESEQIKAEQQNKNLEFQLQLSREDREDKQKHDIDVQTLMGEIKKEIELLKAGFKQDQIMSQADNKIKEIQASQNMERTTNV